MSLFDVLTLKAKDHMATFLKDVEYDKEEDWDDAKDNEFDNWWQEFVNEEFSWIKKKLTEKNLDELAEVNHEYVNEYPEVKLRVSVKEMLSRYKTWKCDPEFEWDNYSLLTDMFEEQWKTKFPEAV